MYFKSLSFFACLWLIFYLSANATALSPSASTKETIVLLSGHGNHFHEFSNQNNSIVSAVLANDDAAVTFMNVAIMLLVLNNDQGDNLSLQIIVPPAHGTASVNVGNSITYTPATAYIGTDFFTYRITDTATGESDIANVNMTIQSSPLSVITALDDAAQTLINTPITIEVLGNDIGTGITLSAIAALPQHGDVTLNAANGTMTYTPDPDFVGTDNFAYLASGGGGSTDIGNVSVSVIQTSGGNNNPPYSVTLSYCAAPMQGIIICDEFFDPDGDDTHVDVAASTTTFHCSLNTVGTADSCIRYTPLPGFFGIDTVHIVVCDNHVPAACSESIAVIYVNAGGCTQPTAIADNVSISNGLVALNGTATLVENPYLGVLIGVTSNDENVCGGVEQLSIGNIIAMPNNGTAQIVSGQIWYDPNTAFSGTDVLQYSTCNACGLCDTTTVSINVAAQTTETCEIHENLCIAPFTAVEVCPEFCTFTAINASDLAVSASAGIAQAISGTSCFNYIPPTLTSGNPTVSFTACNTTICETYTIHITIDVACGDNPPIANDDAATVNIGQSSIINVLTNDNDPEGETLTLNGIVALPTCGTAEIVANQIVFFATAGCPEIVTLTYAVCDAGGLCDTATVNIAIISPDTNCDNETELCTVPFNPTELSYLEICAHFCDLNEGAHITDANTTFHCSISLLNDSCFTYLPLPGFTGTDQIEAYACDNAGLCDTLTFTVHVGCTLPIALNDNATTIVGQPINLSPLANDTDPCGNTLTTAVATPPQNGTVIINADNTFTYTPNVGFTGTETFTYTACSPCSASETCDAATITIAVTPVGGSQPPVANNDAAIAELNQAIEIVVLTNDNDPDNTNSELSVTIAATPTNGTATVTMANSVIYEPNTDFNGTDVFSYTLCDPSGECSTATITVTVSPPINAQPDIVYTTQGTAVDIYVLGNDEGQNVTVTGVSDTPNNGGITNADPATGLFTYQPQPDFVGNDYFTYTLCNEVGNCETTLVTIIVLPNDAGNLPPLANNDQAFTPIAMPANIAVTNNDSDPNGNPIAVMSIVVLPLNGTATINTDNTITYTPNGNAPYCDNFAYLVCDNAMPNLCDTAYVQVIVGTATCNNQAPIANDDTATVEDGETVLILTLDNDTSSDDLIADMYAASEPQYGSLSTAANGFYYTPNDNFTGTDYFTYIICDSGAPTLCDTAFVSISVTPQAVNAQPDIDYTNESIPVEIAVLTNDEGTDIIVSSIVSNPANGSLTVNPNDGSITYSPVIGFVGVDYLEYQICDPIGNCDITLVTIYILAGGGNNIAPSAVNDTYIVPFNGVANLPVLNNDSDPLGGYALSISIDSNPINGTLSDNGDGTLNYIPTANFSGMDSFTYIICDNFTPALCDTATVIIVVTDHAPAPNYPPLAANDFALTEVNTPISIAVLTNDSDPEGDDFVIVWLSPPANGIANITADSVQYVPVPGFVGTDYFAYIICDNGTPSLCDTAYVTVSVTGEPIIEAYDMAVTTPEDTPITICPEDAITFAGFDADVINITTIPENGIIGIDTDTNCLTYLPTANFIGNDTIALTACNATGVCLPVVIYIAITPLSDPPIAQNDTATTETNIPIHIALLDNDSDPDGDALTAIIMTVLPAENGATVQINSDLIIIYTPSNNYVGTDSFAYIITDQTGELSDTAWVYITIVGDTTPVINATITATDDTATTPQNETISISILSNDDIDPDLNNIAIVIIDTPQNGTIIIDLDGSLSYTPNNDFVGTDTLIYQVCGTDANNQIVCDTAMVFIAITPTDEPPTDECGEVKFATGFSPNDDSINDIYAIEGADDDCISQASLWVFNRWGDVVYRADNYQNNMAWNGKWNNQTGNVPDGTYFYIFTCTKNSITEKMQGCMEVVR